MTFSLENDTRTRSTGLYGPALGREVAEIAKFRVTRNRAYAVARNLRFLAYDDEDDEIDEEDKEEEEAREEATEHRHSTTPNEKKVGEEETAKSNVKNDNVDRINKSCETCCLRYPHFPHRKRATNFRVVQFDPNALKNKQLCNHYLAVSYCWQSDASGNSVAAKKSYRVRVQQSDGSYTERVNRAPDAIIDRAVNAALVSGLRLIWIDQECLPQDDSMEQELGIQSMDMVYQRANLTVGLFQGFIRDQSQLDVVAAVMDWGLTKDLSKRILRQRKPGIPVQLFCEYLLEFLEFFVNDQWNQRAWILQEAFSSAGKLAVLIRTAPSVSFHHPPASVFEHNPNWIPGTFTIFISDILKLFKTSREFLMAIAGSSTMSGQVVPQLGIVPTSVYQSEWFQRATHILYKVDELYAVPVATTNRHAFMYAIGGGNFSPRYTCTAAVALYFIRARLNHRPADRLAIVANMCDYEIRLDTVEIEKRFKSLATCLFTLSFINGDLSLLVPDVYQASRVQAPIEGPTWSLPFPEILYSVKINHLRAGWNLSLRSPNRYKSEADSITLPAYAWNVNRKVDLSIIKKRWESSWQMFTCFQVEFEHREHETQQESIARRTKATQDVKEYYNLDNQEYKATAMRPALELDPKLGAKVVRVLSAGVLDKIERARWVVSSILLDTIHLLYKTGDISLANSVWSSIRGDCVKINDDSGENWEESNCNGLPDDVADLIGNEEISISKPWLLLQLDRDNQGSYNQMWLLNRIMTYGHIWAGKYMAPTKVGLNSNKISGPDEKHDSTDSSASLQHQERFRRPDILQSQTSKQLIAYTYKGNIHEEEWNSGEGPEISIGAFVNLAYLYGSKEQMADRETRLGQQVSAFDVDQECWVVTPYDSDMERLPRPALRSMACAWVVERAPLDTESGVENISSSPVANEEKLAENGEQNESAKDTLDTIQEDDKLSVKSHVRGVWDIMEEPTHHYRFI